MLNVISWDGEGSESMVAGVIEWPCWRRSDLAILSGEAAEKKRLEAESIK
jgi:hypothetical protein